MKCTIPEISWHNREPVLSVDIQASSDKFYRLATGGADCHVLIWQLMVSENGAVKTEALSDLTRHQKAVNSVRWSPNGQYLATADDDANIITWQLKTDNIPLLEGNTSDKETWIVYKVMRGHKEDIYDLCWSPNGLKLLSGSIDNTAILWDFAKGTNEQILTDHKGFVQGVAWDPKACYIATISTDRVCRIYEASGKHVRQRLQKGSLSVPTDHYLYGKDVKYFHDDTFKSFFRRLEFSPDGALLAVPSGRIEVDECKRFLNCTLIFAVDAWACPIALLPLGHQCSTVVRFCPIMFKIQEKGPAPIISIPFRMILAVGTDHDVILYDTQQIEPFAYFKDVHYTRLTDLTWSQDGLLLIASSTDGYCALITFEPNELGVEYVKEESEVEESVLNVSGCEELNDSETVKPKKLNLLEKWTVKTPKKEHMKKRADESHTKINETIKGETAKQEIKENRIASIPEVEDKKLSEQNYVVKRIKPIPVGVDKDASINPVKKKETVTVSPLVSLLKNKRAKTAILEPVVMDEVEARDAWQCDKEETKTTEIINLDSNEEEYTEEFSLQLEESINSKIEPDKSEQTSKMKENAMETNVTDIADCISDKECVDQDQIKSIMPLPEEKVNIPKRRVPLITLSSPKHTKK